MEKGLIGRKLGMTQLFWDDGSRIPVTVIEAGPCFVIQKKTKEKDGYDAVQMGFDPAMEKRVTKPRQGHMKKAGQGYFKVLRELRVDAPDRFEVGQELRSDLFEIGDHVDVIGTTKGRGFAGSVKRHKFRGGRGSHGSMFHRAPGSIGASAWPSRVFKGKRLPGHMGDARLTVRNLTVLGVQPERNLLIVHGAVPGHRNGIVFVREAITR